MGSITWVDFLTNPPPDPDLDPVVLQHPPLTWGLVHFQMPPEARQFCVQPRRDFLLEPMLYPPPYRKECQLTRI